MFSNDLYRTLSHKIAALMQGLETATGAQIDIEEDGTIFIASSDQGGIEARKRIGLQVMLFLVIFAGLLYYTKKKVWSRMPDGSPAH